MTQDEIIEMAIQAGISEEIAAFNIPIIEAFAKLIAAKALAHRTWVGLTDKDWKEIEDMPDTFDQGVAWAQAKLKQKNGYAKERTWVGLTDGEFDYLRDNNFGVSPLISEVEAKLKKKNGYAEEKK
jgi:hypothetical protein